MFILYAACSIDIELKVKIHIKMAIVSVQSYIYAYYTLQSFWTRAKFCGLALAVIYSVIFYIRNCRTGFIYISNYLENSPMFRKIWMLKFPFLGCACLFCAHLSVLQYNTEQIPIIL